MKYLALIAGLFISGATLAGADATAEPAIAQSSVHNASVAWTGDDCPLCRPGAREAALPQALPVPGDEQRRKGCPC